MILVLDAYDSFVQTLARYFREAGHDTRIERADASDAGTFLHMAPRAVILSPGPKRPADAGAMVEVCRQAPPRLPILGVCLGHQCIVEAFGGQTIGAPQPVHGRATAVRHDGDRIFDGLPDPFSAGRYHSLVGAVGPSRALTPIAWSDGSTLMGVRHPKRPVVGLQFHPESVLTPDGRRIIANFLRYEVGS